MLLKVMIESHFDQHESSPYNINTKASEKVMRINKMITKGKFLSLILKIYPSQPIHPTMRKYAEIIQENLHVDIRA